MRIFFSHIKYGKLYFLTILLMLMTPSKFKLSLIHANLNLDKEIYAYYGNEITVNFYDTVKNNRFQITSNYIKYLKDEKMIWFTQPEIIFFNKKNIPVWKISCEQAKLIEKNILDLNGYVFINKIIDYKYTESIITKRVLVNLIDHNMISNNKTIVHGHPFYSISSKLYVDFRTQTIKLFGKIYTQYEIR